MSYLHFTRTRSRSRDRASSPPVPLLRRTTSKRPRLFPSSSSDSEEADDYPYSGAHRPSRALTVRPQPSQLERWNIWSDARAPARYDSCAPAADEQAPLPSHRQRRVSFADEVNADEEQEFRLRVAATLSRSRTVRRRSPSPPLPSRRRYQSEDEDERVRARVWTGEMLRRRERCVSEDYEARERSRERRYAERGWCGDGDLEGRDMEAERVVRWRRVKRTKTEEWRPLSGWRRV